MRLELNKVKIIDLSMLQLTIIMLAFKDFNLLAYVSQLVAFGIVFFCRLRVHHYSINRSKLRYLDYKVLFIIWCMFSYLWAMNKDDVISWSMALLVRTLTGFTIILYVDSRKNRDNMIRFMLVAAGLLCLRMIVSVPMAAWGTERVGNYLAHNASHSYGNTGITYVLGIISIYLFPDLKIINKNIIRYLMICLFTLFSLLSGSKKQILFLIICLLFNAILKNKSLKKTLQNILIAVLVLAGGLVCVMKIPLLYNAIGIRLLSFLSFLGFSSTVAADSSSIGRSMIIAEAIRVFKSSPLIGVGIANFKYSDHYALIWAENNFLELLADVGIIGAVLYYLIYLDIIKIIVKRFRERDANVMALLLVCICLLVVDVTMVSYANTTLQFHLACLFAFSYLEKVNGKIKSGNLKGVITS